MKTVATIQHLDCHRVDIVANCEKLSLERLVVAFEGKRRGRPMMLLSDIAIDRALVFVARWVVSAVRYLGANHFVVTSDE